MFCKNESSIIGLKKAELFKAKSSIGRLAKAYGQFL